MEMLSLAKDCDICNRDFKVDELTRHFVSANQSDHNASTDRHKLPSSAASARIAKTVSSRTARSARGSDPLAAAMGAKGKNAAPDMQLNVYEFINFLARVAFWRANPHWGSKYNKRDLTPVPEAVDLLLKE